DFVQRDVALDHRTIGLFLFENEAFVRSQNLSRSPTGNNRLEPLTVTQTASHSIDQLAHRHGAKLHFEVAWPNHVSADADDAGSGIVRPAQPGILSATHGDDVLYVTQRLDVIDDRGRHIEPQHRREIRWLDPRISAFSFQRFD